MNNSSSCNTCNTPQDVLFETELSGRVAIKKNSKQLIRTSKRLYILPSSRYASWERDALINLKQAFISKSAITCPLMARFTFYFLNRQHQSDIDNMLGGPMDVLQKAGIINNDSQIQKVVAEKLFGFDPKIKIQLYKHTAGVK